MYTAQTMCLWFGYGLIPYFSPFLVVVFIVDCSFGQKLGKSAEAK